MDPFTQIAIALAMMIVSYVITAAMVKAPEPQKPAALADFTFPQADEGTPQAVFFGDCWTSGWMVLWYGNLRSTAIKSDGSKK